MNKARTAIFVLALLSTPLLGSSSAAEDTVPASKYIRITQDVLKPGSGREYEQVQAARLALLKDVKWPRPTVALRPLTGIDQVLKLNFFQSFEDWGNELNDIDKTPGLKTKLKELDQQEAGALQSKRVMATIYHPDISYRGDFDWSEVRCISIISIHLRPGHGAEYGGNRRIVLKAHTEAQLPEHLAMYTVSSGALSGTYLVMRPVTSMKEFDAMGAMHHGAYDKVLGEENRKQLQALFASSVETEEETYFCADPQMSYAPTGWAHSQQEFWRGVSTPW
jgi:hypothetical protein